MTPIQIVVFAIACLLIGLSKGGLGGPLPISLTTALLTLVMHPAEAIVLVLPFLIFADIFALYTYWQQWDNRLLLVMLPPAVIGVMLGGWYLAIIPADILRLVIAVATLIVIAYKLLADYIDSINYKAQNWHSILAGGLSGFSSALANTGAPPFTIYMLLRKTESISFIGTATLFFAIVNVLKIPIYFQRNLIQFDAYQNVIWGVLIVPIGVWLGRRALDYISQTVFERIMLILLLIIVVMLLIPGR